MQVVIPDVNTINLKRYNALKYLSKTDDMDAQTAIKFLSNYLEIDEEILMDNQHSNNVELFYEVCQSLNNLKTTDKPLPKIKVNGKTYTFRDITNSNFSSLWYMTIQRYLSQEIEAHQIAAFVYIEEGLKYNQQKDGKILNPLQTRMDEFEQHMTASQYHPLGGFFLQKYNEYKLPFLALQKARIKLHQRPAKLSGRG